MTPLPFSLFLLAASAATLCACPKGSTTLLSCTMKGGSKTLDVCITGKTVTYAYGPARGKPELRLAEPVKTVRHEPWNGVSRTIWETVTFVNGPYSYEAALSFDKPSRSSDGFLTVKKGDKEIVEIACDAGSAKIGLFALTDAKEKQGVCWDMENRLWHACK